MALPVLQKFENDNFEGEIKMSEKNIKSRVVLKHDVESNWQLATGFCPLKGELVIYDPDNVYNYSRLKIGDGARNINDIPFVDDAIRDELILEINDIDNKIDSVSDLVGNVKVSDQISAAINDATADNFGIYVQDTEPTYAVAGDIWIDTANNPSYIPPTLPQITESDNGKVLMVVNGSYQLVSLNLSVDNNGVVYM